MVNKRAITVKKTLQKIYTTLENKERVSRVLNFNVRKDRKVSLNKDSSLEDVQRQGSKESLQTVV